GDDLLRAAADLPARHHLAEAGALAALPVWHRSRRHLTLHDGRWHARHSASALGHRADGCHASVRAALRRLPDDGAQRNGGGDRLLGRHPLHPDYGRHRAVGQEARQGRHATHLPAAQAGRGGRRIRQPRDGEAAGNDHPRFDLLPVLRPLLLRQLEVPVGNLVAALRRDGGRHMLAAVRIVATLLKLRIGVTIAASALAGLAVAAGEPASPGQIAALALAVLGAAGAAGAFNHYWERDSDRLMARTAGRPFASGELKPG